MKHRVLQENEIVESATRIKMKVVRADPISKGYPMRNFMRHLKGSYKVIHEGLLKSYSPALSFNMFYKLADDVNFDGANIVPCTIELLCDHYKLSKPSIYMALKSLREADLVRRVNKDSYILSP